MASDLISRKALLERLKKIYDTNSIVDKIMLRFLKKLICKQPTVDAVEVVRCKDCRHKDFRYYDKESVFCYMSGKYRHIDDFCSYGAKMDGGEK